MVGWYGGLIDRIFRGWILTEQTALKVSYPLA